MRVEKNVPEIRFDGFNGQWGFKTIEALIDEEILYPPKDGNHGDIHPKATDYVEYGIPFVMANNIKGGKIKFHDCYHINLSQAETLQKGFAKTGDVLLTHKGTVGEVAVIPQIEFPYLMLTPQVTYYRICGTAELDTYFLATSFVTNSFQSPLKQEAGGGTRAYLGITAQQKLGISIPPEFEEQIKIGNYFQKLDSLINQHQQKHDKLSNIKKSMMERMFPKQGETIPEIRFKEFSGEWEEKELSEEVTFINGRAYSQEELQDKGKYTILRVGNFYTNSSWYYSDMELGAKYYTDYGDLLYTWSASFGPHIWNGDKVIYHYHIWKLELSENIDKLFLLHLLDYDRAKILSGSNGSTMIHITKSAMEAKKVFIPKKDEQTAIGNYFQKLDALINQHQQQITKLNNVKQACLSKMFV
jgi:type I restriction enzyme S subunit